MRSRIWIMILVMSVVFMGSAVVMAQGSEDTKAHPSCKYCGMDRQQFAHSRVLIEYDDGTSLGACSIHCAALDLALHIDKTPKSILVGDYTKKELIDANSATWVIGGGKPGVMTKRAKWAFGKKEDAEKFVKENGGTLSTFDQVMKAAYEDMYDDTKMIRDKRKAKGTPKHNHGEPKHDHQEHP
jgi:copper chaperone NosL